MKEFSIVGRAAPTQKKPSPKTYRMRIFAKNHVIAKSRFWYFMRKIAKAKKLGGEILKVDEIEEKNPLVVKNYSIWLRYDSRKGTHNMTKEFRDVTSCGAVERMYAEMSGTHRALPSNIQIIKLSEVKNEELVKPKYQQYIPDDVKFP
eukprot:Filipodium_phascolosomae@DN1083_c0_g1_i1.p1